MQYVFIAIAVLGVLFGLNCYWHLWKWARMAQRATIAIAYNNRVQLNATMVEWMTWANALKGQEAKGRTVYRNNKMTVTILRPEANVSAKTTISKVRRFSRARRKAVA